MFVLTHMCRIVFCLKGASFGKPRAVTHSFHMCLVVVVFCLKAPASGNVMQTEREKAEKKVHFLRSVLMNRYQEKVDGMLRGEKLVILIRLRMNSILMDEIFENTLNEEHNKLFLVKILLRENCNRLTMTWRSRIWR